MNSQPLCLNCNNYLFKFNNSWQCVFCSAEYVSFDKLSVNTSEYIYSKFLSDVESKSIISIKNCPCCSKRMTKILGFLNLYQLEACLACRMVWIGNITLEKIKMHQLTEIDKPVQLKMMSSFDYTINIMSKSGHSSIPGVNILAGFFDWAVNNLYFGAFSKKHPVFSIFFTAFAGGIVLIVIYWFYSLIFGRVY